MDRATTLISFGLFKYARIKLKNAISSNTVHLTNGEISIVRATVSSMEKVKYRLLKVVFNAKDYLENLREKIGEINFKG